MRATLCLIGGMLMAAAVPAHSAPRVEPEARLAKALAGRVAGKPVDCIQLRQIQSSEIFERTAILYKSGSTWYVNRPASGANFLNRDDVLVTDTHSSNLCSIDIVRLLDSSSHFPSGSLGLGKFVPYTKPKG
ncbi:hypothetical protein ASE00_07900 [Sphingomonas sp. Root710]|uniref:hypothetical protein n=1 Tax=Sphingomonas sp. Root710 TaxID=1736594 RepID=UPI0006F52340|nr:hypothetical protein [Sphingomonas sp. Root710]KRB86941.1 hypothetical protein ASE00_07900 [Sphingomonas sp. Root710]